MRVVDLTQWYSPVSGGIRTYLHAKAEWAARTGHEHAAVVTGDRPGRGDVAGSAFVQVRGRTPAGRWGYRVAPRPGPVLAALDALDPDVVVLHDALAFPRAVARWAAARGTGLAMVCHSDLALGAAGLPRVLRRPAGAALGVVQRRALGAPSAVLVASDATRDRVAPHVTGPVVTSPFGVDLATFGAARPDDALRERLAPPPARMLVYAGRLSSEKRIDLLPGVLAALGPGHVLVVAGTGAAQGLLERGARRLGVEARLVLLGHVSGRATLARLLASADCFVHPNPTEPFGLAPLEALAAGCRVVAPATVGSADLLWAHGAVLVDPGDAEALADGVRDALSRGRPPRAGCPGWDESFGREWDVYRSLVAA